MLSLMNEWIMGSVFASKLFMFSATGLISAISGSLWLGGYSTCLDRWVCLSHRVTCSPVSPSWLDGHCNTHVVVTVLIVFYG